MSTLMWGKNEFLKKYLKTFTVEKVEEVEDLNFNIVFFALTKNIRNPYLVTISVLFLLLISMFSWLEQNIGECR